MSLIRPSPAIVVNSDTTIAESIQKMRENRVGSVLIVRASVPHDLMGIFTERDLLNHVEEIQQGAHWQKSITTVMKKDVYTVSVYELALAPEIMIKYKIRHLPVVYVGSDSHEHLAGMLSMRDLFQQAVEDSTKAHAQQLIVKDLEIGLICNDEHAKGGLLSVLRQGGKAAVRELEMTGPLPRVDILVVDIDYHPAMEWSSFLRKLNLDPACPPLMILFSPGLHEAKNVKVLHQIDDSKKISIFAKPVSIFGLLQHLRKGF